MDVVLDVNVFLSAALGGAGPSAALVAGVRDGRLSAVASSRLLIELRDVLRRDRFRPYLSLEEVDEYVAEVAELCRLVDDPRAVPKVVRNPDDDYLVALASEAATSAIVSGDLDLRKAVGRPWRFSRPGRPWSASPSDRSCSLSVPSPFPHRREQGDQGSGQRRTAFP